MSKSILIVEDETDIAELVGYNLRKEGFSFFIAPDGETALKEIGTKTYDLVLLDLMLPGMQGLEICRIIKSRPDSAHIPIIMLTAKSEEIDKILGLEMGADDYVTKPFSSKELVARVKAVLRRTDRKDDVAQKADKNAGSTIRVGAITIDKERYTVTVEGRSVQLGVIEFKLLVYLAKRPNRIYNRNQLLDAVWGNSVYVEPRTVDVHIRRLRMKIESDPDNPKYIKTMRGLGYFLEVKNDEAAD
ncbi:MAG: response regulator transcription factor [Nitrospirota bacterium]